MLASLTRLIADVILAVPTAKADYGFTRLWPSRANVSFNGALAPRVYARWTSWATRAPINRVGTEFEGASGMR
jgi:hypothetical protein